MRPDSSIDPRATPRIAALCALLVVLLAVAPAIRASAPIDGSRVEWAEFVFSDSVVPPKNGWSAQALPDSWMHDHPAFPKIARAWYRVRFHLDTVPREPIALYVGRVSTTGEFWLNGSVLNPGVRFDDLEGPTGSEMSRWPYLFVLVPGLLRAGDNVLHIRVEGTFTGGRGGLWDLRIGPLDRLRVPWLVREIPQTIIPQALLVLMLAGAILGLLVWWRERRARNTQFTVVTLLWTVIVATWVFPTPSLTRLQLSLSFTVLYITFYWTLLDLLYRYSESDWRWYPRVLNIVSALALVAAVGVHMFTFNWERGGVQMALILLSTVVLRILATVMLLQSAWRKRSPRAYALAATEVLWFAGHVQIICIIAGWVPPDPFRLEPAGSLPLYLVLLYFFVERLVREREQAVRDRESAVTVERARILQDMHDGLGSQLIVAARLARHEDADRAMVVRGIEGALEDLRLIVDSLDADRQSLVSRLASLRHRLEPQLAALGVRLAWDAQPLSKSPDLPPRSALHVLRIVQEALNNAVKHARAATIGISIAELDGAPVISVADDGTGFDPLTAEAAGRGLSGMRRRAELLGARLVLGRRDGGGTVVSLHIPPASSQSE